MPFPWMAIATLASTLLPMLLRGRGGGDQEPLVQEQITEQEPRGYQSPLLGLLDPWMVQSLLGRYGLLQGAGMPGGAGGMSPFTEQIMQLLNQQFPELLAGYGAGEGGMKRRGGRGMAGEKPITAYGGGRYA